MELAAFGATLDTEDAAALFAQYRNNRIQQCKNDRIGHSLSQRKMKIKIGLDICIRIIHAPVHHGDRFTHERQMLLVDPRGCQGAELRLDDLSYFNQIA